MEFLPEEDLIKYKPNFTFPRKYNVDFKYFTVKPIDIPWFVDYIVGAKTTCKDGSWSDWYFDLGMREESGELCGVVKRIFRGDYTSDSVELKEKLFKELGDVLWYTAMTVLFIFNPNYLCDPYHFKFTLTNYINEKRSKYNCVVSDNIVYNVKAIQDNAKEIKHIDTALYILNLIDATAKLMGSSIEEIGQINSTKLADRWKRNAISGTGDNR